MRALKYEPTPPRFGHGYNFCRSWAQLKPTTNTVWVIFTASLLIVGQVNRDAALNLIATRHDLIQSDLYTLKKQAILNMSVHKNC